MLPQIQWGSGASRENSGKIKARGCFDRLIKWLMKSLNVRNFVLQVSRKHLPALDMNCFSIWT